MISRKATGAILIAGLCVIALAALLPVIISSFGALPPKKKDYSGAIPLDVSFEVRPKKKLRVPTGLSCEDVTKTKYGLAAYESVRKKLFDGVHLDSIEYLDCWLPPEDIVGSVEDVRRRFLNSVFSSNVLYGFLKREYRDLLFEVVRQGNLRHGTIAWGSGTLGSAALLAYKRTGQKRFVRSYIDFFQRIMDMRDSVLGIHDDYHNRIMDAWGSANLGRNSGDPSLWVAHVTHFSVIMTPATGFARLIKETPALSEFDNDANTIIEFFESAYRQFDSDLKPAAGTDEEWYWRPLVDKFEATNHVHIQGQALLNMYAITGDEFYADRIRWIIRVFEKGVEIDEDGFIAWNYFPYLQVPEAMNDSNSKGYSEYVWKAGLTVPFLYAAKHQGFAIDPAIMVATTKNIREHVLANNELAEYFHPRNPGPIPEGENKNSIIGYLSAVVDDPEIETRIVDIVTTRPDLYSNGWLSSGKMALGYAFQLGREDKRR